MNKHSGISRSVPSVSRQHNVQTPSAPITDTFIKNQTPIFVLILSLAVAAYHLNPDDLILRSFFFLSYKQPNGTYLVGPLDLITSLSFTVLLTLARGLLMDHVFIPLAAALNVSPGKRAQRFAEQAWTFIYYTPLFIYGLIVYINSPYAFDKSNLWKDWPHLTLSHSFKLYYLIQVGFWLHQLYVLNIEERRKDYYQMLSHHICTSTLVLLSYYFHMFRVGHCILVLMDFVDITLPLAKMLKYTNHPTLCDCAFVNFIISWIVTRHYMYILLVWSVLYDASSLIPYGTCISPEGDFFNSSSPRCFTRSVHYTFVGMLCFIQILTILWFTAIVKVALKVLKGDGAEDSRSDDENED
ncbi:hypothetical protein CANCADRAFT_133693 [Tortispora caseinolytica NRRL Y-17796]|uniref:TLC domain-containing protein n=1 Tax=Tortispora caseinolytica NRRL Y-17796 TaxID=767744 RepID=A0A1E4TBF5_9ASCO|nr:hypothetical protein CANCADRAFT_133693 [Tortispora caseinolytica NRRL Y-17796]